MTADRNFFSDYRQNVPFSIEIFRVTKSVFVLSDFRDGIGLSGQSLRKLRNYHAKLKTFAKKIKKFPRIRVTMSKTSPHSTPILTIFRPPNPPKHHPSPSISYKTPTNTPKLADIGKFCKIIRLSSHFLAGILSGVAGLAKFLYLCSSED